MSAKRTAVLLLALLFASTCISAQVEPPPRRIILLIGDGMGPVHVETMRIVAEPFHLARIRHRADVATRSADSRITDSAAAATAIATGFKTNNRMVSVDPNGRRLRTVLEQAASQGLATGVVTTTSFFDATPAAFTAHVRSRADGTAIVGEMLAGPTNVIIGAGAEVFGGQGRPTIEQAVSASRRTLVTSGDASSIPPDSRILRAFRRQENDVDFPGTPLAELAAFALDVLDEDSDGFFVLIEHEGIDSASHNHADAAMLASLRSFNDTIGVALQFAAKHPDTLVLVTGDHETGGLRIEGSTPADLKLHWSTTGHTPRALPVYAHGPGAESFNGIRDNTEIAGRLFALLAARKPARRR